MLLRYALLGAAALAVAGIAEVQAQSPFPPVGQQAQQPSPFPPVGGQQPQQSSPFPPAGGQQPASPFTNPGRTMIPQMGQMGQPQQPPEAQQMPPCAVVLTALARESEKRFDAAKAGAAKKLGAPEMCRLLTQFTDADNKMIKGMEEQAAACGIPPEAIKTRKTNHVQGETYKKQACDAAANPAAPRGGRPAEPTLSDAFAPPPLTGSNTRTGRGTLDSLGGNPLAR